MDRIHYPAITSEILNDYNTEQNLYAKAKTAKKDNTIAISRPLHDNGSQSIFQLFGTTFGCLPFSPLQIVICITTYAM